MDVADVRKHFPIFSHPGNEGLVYLDSAATTQRPTKVLDAIRHFNEEYNSNIHRSAYKLAEKATAGYECARLLIAQFTGAAHSHEIIFTRGATEAINFVMRGWGEKFLKPGDEILLSEMEHHSNLVPWQVAAQKSGAKLKFIPFDDNGELELGKLDDLLTARTRLVAITHASNVLGTRVDVKRIIDAAHAAKAVVLVDGAQHVPHSPLNVQDLDADFYVFSGHKMLGPMGIGILYGKEALLDAMDPVLYGGSMIDDVRQYESTWAELPWKFEAGTQNIPAVIGLGAAIELLEEWGLRRIEEHDKMLTSYVLRQLEQIDFVTVYGPREHRNPVISFAIQGIHAHDIATFFDSRNIAIRSGHHCAKLIMKKLNISATARASFYLYNTTEHVDLFVDAIHKARGYFARWI
ncbi:SufS family cysteine desulfurase [candidate division KSB1 bacterium]|nr:SufS family cysteine desulfurase [candidate division KSB1 bacterium]RQW03348.1 MAG: SufS family cysteine desulfurase [candidate division KSB1 bacterium]